MKGRSVARNNEIRIIGGQWRSRKLQFPTVEGLRPTPDRVRETLFNWLRDDIRGARCLDLFAGSGALGFEAASRGAARVVMVDADARVCSALRQACGLLDASAVQVFHEHAARYLATASERFDVVFLDPPFHKGWISRVAPLLESGGWLGPNALIYLETETRLPLTDTPARWRLLKQGAAGEVAYHLYRTQDE